MNATIAAETFTQARLKAAGVSPRRADYWTTRGWLKAERGRAAEGSEGRPDVWRYSLTEVRVAVLMNRLVDAGLGAPLAAEVARSAVDFLAWAERRHSTVRVALGRGVQITVEVGDLPC